MDETAFGYAARQWAKAMTGTWWVTPLTAVLGVIVGLLAPTSTPLKVIVALLAWAVGGLIVLVILWARSPSRPARYHRERLRLGAEVSRYQRAEALNEGRDQLITTANHLRDMRVLPGQPLSCFEVRDTQRNILTHLEGRHGSLSGEIAAVVIPEDADGAELNACLDGMISALDGRIRDHAYWWGTAP